MDAMKSWVIRVTSGVCIQVQQMCFMKIGFYKQFDAHWTI